MTSSITPTAAATESLRVIAHPARIRLYELLLLHGVSTVSTLAGQAGIAVGSASYHLHQLHGAGYIEDAADQGSDGRTQWWRAVPGGLKWEPSDFVDSASGREVSTAAQQVMWARRMDRLSTWLRGWHTFDRAWIDAAIDTDVYMKLAPEELEELSQELAELIRRWIDRTTGDATRPDRESVFMLLSAFPLRSQDA